MNKKNKTNILYVIFLGCLCTLIFYSCQPKYALKGKLLLIDSMSEKDPITAQQRIKEAKQKGDYPLPILSLLEFKAKNNAGQDIRKDSSAFLSLPFIKSKGDELLLAMNYYYIGRYYAVNNDAPQAIKSFVLADSTIRRKHDKKSLALKVKIASQEGYIYYYRYLTNEAMKAFSKSYEYSSQLKDTTNMIFCLKDIASCYADNNQRNKSIKLCRKALYLSQESSDTLMRTIISTQLARHYNEIGKTKEAHYFLQYPLNHPYQKDLTTVYYIAEAIYKALGEKDSMVFYLKKLERQDDPYAKQEASRGLANYYLQAGDLASTKKQLNNYILYTDSINQLSSTDAVEKANALYNYTLHEEKSHHLEKQNQKMRETIIVAISMALLIIIILISYLYINKQRNEKLRYKLEIYKQRIAQNSITKRESQAIDLYSNPVFSNIMKRVKSTESNKHLNNQYWQEIYAEIERIFPNFLSDLRKLCKMNEHEEHVCILIRLGFSPKDISELTAHSRSSISLTRKRLYKRAFGNDENPSEWDKIIKNL